MKKLNLFLAVITFLFIANKSFSQMDKPPAPISNEFLTNVLGTWVSNPYELMGTKMTDEITHTMILNGQFMEIDVKGTGDNGFVYEAKGIVAPSPDGTSITGWFYDIFGKNAISTYTGLIQNGNANLMGTSSWGTESRDISFQGDIMLQAVSFKMKDKDGKETTQNLIITYNRKK